jgi:hypothetical protein
VFAEDAARAITGRLTARAHCGPVGSGLRHRSCLPSHGRQGQADGGGATRERGRDHAEEGLRYGALLDQPNCLEGKVENVVYAPQNRIPGRPRRLGPQGLSAIRVPLQMRAVVVSRRQSRAPTRVDSLDAGGRPPVRRGQGTRTTSSTRRLSLRPVGLSLPSGLVSSTTGTLDPRPTELSRDRSMPLVAR